MKIEKNTENTGQILILFAVGLIVLIAVAALVLDSGQTYMNRRQAQAAADAGALAGVYQMCGGSGDPITTAVHYATVENGATSATATINYASEPDELLVDVVIQQPTFFSQLLGFPPLAVPASAAAGCYAPGGMKNVLPVAWTCKPPTLGYDELSDDCAYVALDWETEMLPLITGVPATVTSAGKTVTTPMDFKNTSTKNNFTNDFLPQIYLFMDTAAVQADCAPNGTLDCDFNNDGQNDLGGMGGKNWLDLDGSLDGGASIPDEWLEEGFDGYLAVHTWVPEANGSKANVFDIIEAAIIDAPNIIDRIAWLPIVNYVSVNDPPSSADQYEAHNNPDFGWPLLPGDTEVIIPGNPKFFHIVGFAPIYVTCANKSGGDSCPGRSAAVAAGLVPNNNKVKSLEGYFLTGNVPMDHEVGGTGGVDIGPRIRSLTR